MLIAPLISLGHGGIILNNTSMIRFSHASVILQWSV
jgi:hypothetical protein